jgi:hypothetical protein
MGGRGWRSAWRPGSAVLALVLAAAFSACGGDDEPTPAEKRAAKARWVQKVDAACRKANEAIADRGWPMNLVDLDRLVVRGAADVREAVKTIVALRLPVGSGPAPRRFVQELRKLEPLLAEVEGASENMEGPALLGVTDDLKVEMSRLEDRSREAGLADCARNDERFFLPDAIRAPVFAEQMAKLDRSVFRRLERLERETNVNSAADATRFYVRLGEVINDTVAGMDKLDPPQWAATQLGRYQDVLLDLQTIVQDSEELFAQGTDALTLGKLNRLGRRYDRIIKAEKQARRKLFRAVGAAPTTGPGDEPEEALAPDEAQES